MSPFLPPRQVIFAISLILTGANRYFTTLYGLFRFTFRGQFWVFTTLPPLFFLARRSVGLVPPPPPPGRGRSKEERKKGKGQHQSSNRQKRGEPSNACQPGGKHSWKLQGERGSFRNCLFPMCHLKHMNGLSLSASFGIGTDSRKNASTLLSDGKNSDNNTSLRALIVKIYLPPRLLRRFTYASPYRHG